MDINKYAVFSDIADTLNFTKSGERMGYTQSGISHLLKTMERELGFPLFLRSKQGVALTEEAKQLLPLVHNLLNVNEQLEQTIDSINGIQSGHITIASFNSIARNWLPPIIRTFQEKYPNIELELLEGNTDDIVNWILSNRADFGLLSHQNVTNLEWFSLCEDPLMAILPKEYSIEGVPAFPVASLADQPFIMSTEDIDYDTYHTLETANLPSHKIISSKDDHVIVSMVAQNLGFSILPRLATLGVEHLVNVLPLEPFASRELGIALRSFRDCSPAAQKFIREVKRFISQMNL